MHKKAFIWFDLGYTLIKLDREKRYRKLLHSLNLDRSPEDLALAFHRADKTFMREYPGLLGSDPGCYMPWYLGLVNYHLGISLNLVRVMNLWMDPAFNPGGSWICYGETHTTLKKLKTHGYRLGIISNWDLSARRIISSLDLEVYMDSIIISSEQGCEKPERAIFDAALAAAGVSAEESLCIGDNYYHDVIGSRRAGMDNLLLNRYGRIGIEEITDVEVIGSLEDILPHLR